MTQNSASTLHIDPQEELHAILGRLEKTDGDVLTLVLPDRSLLGQSLVNFKLLLDEAGKLGKQITIVSDQEQTQSLARRAGITVKSSLSAAEPEGSHGFMSGKDIAMGPLPEDGFDEAVAASALSRDSHAKKPLAVASSDALISGRKIPLTWIMGGVVAAILLIGIVGLYMADRYLPHATITLYTQERTIDRDLNVTADPQATMADVKQLVVPATVASADVSKTQTFPASGKKDIGTEATGNVTIYNKTDKDKTFPAGTIISSGQLQFSLDVLVIVPHQSVDVQMDPVTLKSTQVSTPGQSKSAVTATDFGSNYNLASKTTFAVGSLDQTSVVARNDVEFSGGDKQTVTFVTAGDHSDALASLTKASQDDGLVALKAKLNAGQTLLTEAVTYKIATSTFSAAVGDRTDKFTLTLALTTAGPAITEVDLQAMLTKAIQEKVPSGYALDTQHQAITQHVIKANTDGTVDLTATYKARVLPQVDTSAMLHAVQGKNPQAVQDYLKSQPNLNGYDIHLTPKLPGPFNHLPYNAANIKIDVQVKQ